MTVFNYSAATTVHVSQIQIYWNPSSPAGQSLKQIYLGGILIWSSQSTSSPLVVNSFIGDVSIAPGTNKLLQVTFDKNYKDNGTEQILVNFSEPGCPTLDSSNTGQLP